MGTYLFLPETKLGKKNKPRFFTHLVDAAKKQKKRGGNVYSIGVRIPDQDLENILRKPSQSLRVLSRSVLKDGGSIVFETTEGTFVYDRRITSVIKGRIFKYSKNKKKFGKTVQAGPDADVLRKLAEEGLQKANPDYVENQKQPESSSKKK